MFTAPEFGSSGLSRLFRLFGAAGLSGLFRLFGLFGAEVVNAIPVLTGRGYDGHCIDSI